MRHLALLVLLLLPVLAASPCRGEEWLEHVWARMKLDWHRNNKWPDTFNYIERDAVAAPFEVMVYNGWRMQNSIGPYHFEEGSAALTEAGRLKIQWILTQAPPQYRTIFVEQAESGPATAERMRSVRALAARMAQPGESPVVMETIIPARGWSGESVNSAMVKFNNSQPPPVLPQKSTESSGNP